MKLSLEEDRSRLGIDSEQSIDRATQIEKIVEKIDQFADRRRTKFSRSRMRMKVLHHVLDDLNRSRS